MQLALKHKSWKIQLLSDLDEAKESCKSKSEFISFLKNKNYEIRYEKHITVRKIGEKKAIRVDTLAKQFGSQYTKAELEKYSQRHLSLKTEKSTLIFPHNHKNAVSRFYYERSYNNFISCNYNTGIPHSPSENRNYQARYCR